MKGCKSESNKSNNLGKDWDISHCKINEIASSGIGNSFVFVFVLFVFLFWHEIINVPK